MTPSRRRNIYLPDELWRRVVEAAARLSLATGEQVSASEWIRDAIEQRLEREASR